jgi:4-amino-4-deoxy-L-arabinose transferase-like glycosyltransferase
LNTSPSIPGLGHARPAAADRPAQERGPLARLLLGAGDRPAWARPALLTLLAATAVLYLWNLAASGDANSFYAAAVLAGTESWKAFFFGSLDAANFITVDKPPASLWVMELSARLFGFSSWSLLAPEALEGVAAVWILHAAVRRRAGDAAALIAGAALALTPVAVLMFRFDNPDALLTLLLVIGAACTLRATERGGLGWLLLAGATIGIGFLTKSLEAFLILPALILVYAWAAPVSLPRRILHLAAAAGALVVASGWWVAIVQIWPASARPYVGGSTNDSELQLALGYNGLSRIVGQGMGGGGGGGNSLFGGAPGLTRLFGGSMGTQISWLLPAALIALVAGLWMTRRSPRTDLTRAALLLLGGWLLVTGVVFSLMSGIIHPYYTVVLGPPIAGLVAIGGVMLWQRRGEWPARAVMAAMVLASMVWSEALLLRDSSWYPAVQYVVAGAGLIALALLLLAPLKRGRLVAVAAVAVMLIAGLAGPAAYALQTATTPHTGSIPVAGPSTASATMGPGGGSPGGAGFPAGERSGGRPGSGTVPGRGEGFPGGAKGFHGRGGAGGEGARAFPAGTGGEGARGGGGGGMAASNAALTSLLKKTSTTWAAAAVGSQSAASLELSTGGKAVMAIGGFSGSDPAPTLAQFERDVAEGRIAYFIAGGQGGGPGGGSSSAAQITSWVESHFAKTTVGGETVYVLTQKTS